MADSWEKTKSEYTQFLANLRVDFTKAVLPAVAKVCLEKDYAEPAKMIAKTSWDIANELAEIELKRQIEEGLDDDGTD